jgi:hypothetical protein
MKWPYPPALQDAARLAQPYQIPAQVFAMKVRQASRSDSVRSLAENASSRRRFRRPTCR